MKCSLWISDSQLSHIKGSIGLLNTLSIFSKEFDRSEHNPEKCKGLILIHNYTLNDQPPHLNYRGISTESSILHVEKKDSDIS